MSVQGGNVRDTKYCFNLYFFNRDIIAHLFRFKWNKKHDKAFATVTLLLLILQYFGEKGFSLFSNRSLSNKLVLKCYCNCEDVIENLFVASLETL